MPPPKVRPLGEPTQGRVFRERAENEYSLEILPVGITLYVSRLRRTSHELHGELSVSVNGSHATAKTMELGLISTADLNLSAQQSRMQRGKFLADRADDHVFDWVGAVEELCVRVIHADRMGSPDINLQSVPRPTADRMFLADGVQLPLKHPMILFGDGGSAKSYLAIYWAGLMVQQGLSVLYADWEFTAEEHRERLELLFGPEFPAVRYLPCYRSLREERDRIHRAIQGQKTSYLICDSVGVACGADPSSSESATLYFQAVREFGGIGSLHIAHVTKAGDDQKPFGSAFWHNMARMTTNVKSEQVNENSVAIALFPRKRNLRGTSKATAFQIDFGDLQTGITRTDLKDFAVLAEGLPLAERITDALKFGSKTRKELAEMLGVDYGMLQRVIYREVKKGRYVEFKGLRKGSERIGLKPESTEPDVSF